MWAVGHDSLLRLMRERPAIPQLIIRNLANRVIHLMSLVEDLSLRSVVARLARLLLDHSTGDVLSRRPWATQSEMAARLGTVPDVLNRALRSLAEDGLVQMDHRQLKILDREGMKVRAELSE